MLKLLFFLSCLQSIETSNCGQGCLRCLDGECLLCDTLNNYFLEDQSGTKVCTKVLDEKCILNTNGECIGCTGNSKPVFTTEWICQTVSSTLVPPHCLALDKDGKCLICQSPKYLNPNK